MTVVNPPAFDHINTADGRILQVGIINIGPWNMDASDSVNVPNSLNINHNAIVDAVAIIHNDNSNLRAMRLDAIDVTLAGNISGMIQDLRSDIFVLYRVVGGQFDSTDYDDPTLDRGYIMIWYLV